MAQDAGLKLNVVQIMTNLQTTTQLSKSQLVTLYVETARLRLAAKASGIHRYYQYANQELITLKKAITQCPK